MTSQELNPLYLGDLLEERCYANILCFVLHPLVMINERWDRDLVEDVDDGPWLEGALDIELRGTDPAAIPVSYSVSNINV
jgi:hypothetical protein